MFENYREAPSWERCSDYNRLIGRGYVKDDGLVRRPGSVCRDQFFHDGNKRSDQLLANHYLAHEDAGFIMPVPKNPSSGQLARSSSASDLASIDPPSYPNDEGAHAK